MFRKVFRVQFHFRPMFPDSRALSSDVIQIFANPAAGGFRRRKLHGFVAALEKRGARAIVSWSGPEHELFIAEEATAVCSFGGDGTTRHVVTAVSGCGRALPISVFPAGTVNLLAREIEEGSDSKLFGLTNSKNIHIHYLAQIENLVFLTCASAGPDSRAVGNVSQQSKQRLGKYAYVLSFIKQCFRWPRKKIRLEWECGETVCEAFYVAKGKYYAGPWSFAPKASVREPYLYVVALPVANRRNYLKFLLALLFNRIEQQKNLVRFTCKTLRADADDHVPVQADGDVIAQLPVTITVRHDPMTFADLPGSIRNS